MLFNDEKKNGYRKKKMCCSVVYFCRTGDVIVISQNSFLLVQTAARLLKDKLSPID